MYHKNTTESPDDDAVQAAELVLATVACRGGVSPALEDKIITIEQRLLALEGKETIDLDADIARYGKEARAQADIALSAAYYAIVYAWATGHLLNLGKGSLPRNQFGKWRDAKADDLGIGVRTAQNWMKLAQLCQDVRALLIPGVSLTGAYRAAGVLPEPSTTARDESGDGDDDASDTTPTSALEQAFTALTEGRKRLRHQLESGEPLTCTDHDRLGEEKATYINLFDTLLAQPIAPSHE